MTSRGVGRLLALLAAFAVVAGLAATGAAAPKGLGTVQPGHSVGYDLTSVWVTNDNGRAFFGVEDCFGKVAAPGTEYVEFDAGAAVLGVVPNHGGSARVLKTFPDGAAMPAPPAFQSFVKPDQILPTIDGPAQQLQLQIPLDGGSAVQFAGFNPPFLGFTDPFVAGIVVGSDGNPLQNGFEVTLSPTRIEVELLVPGAQPLQFVQPFSFVCRNVQRAESLLEKTSRDLPGIGSVVGSILPSALDAALKDSLRKEGKVFRVARNHIKADEYQPVFELGDSLKKAQKNLDGAIAKALPHIRSAAKHQALVKARGREDADAAATLAAMKQIITPAG